MGYTKYDYRVVKLDHQPYYPRANDPMAMVIKEWEKAILVSRMWHSERMRKAYLENDTVAKQARPTLIFTKEANPGGAMRGARFTTSRDWENIPDGDNASDLESLETESKKRYNEATFENTTSRIKMMLSMLGDVTEVDDSNGVSLWRLAQNAHDFKVFEIKGQKLILFGDSP